MGYYFLNCYDAQLVNLLLLCAWLSLAVKDARGDLNDRSSAGEFFHQDEKLRGYRLQNHLIRTVTATSLTECNLECLREICCKSVNYREDLLGNVLNNCELNHARTLDLSEDLIQDHMYLQYEMVAHAKGVEIVYSEIVNLTNVGWSSDLHRAPSSSAEASVLNVWAISKDENFCCSSPCHNRGTCNSASQRCECLEGFDGRLCEKDVDECVGNVCHSNATCSNSIGSFKCKCDTGFLGNGKNCTAVGSTQGAPAQSCKEIQSLRGNTTSGLHWIKPDRESSQEAFSAYCDMVTDGGGWTLVYSYTFTNYGDFFDYSNAVTPHPNWPASDADVPISTTTPTNLTTRGAMDFNLWKDVGEEFLVRSNINDWIVYQPNGGSLVTSTDGSIVCRNIKNVATTCEGVAPFSIQWRSCGPRIASRSSFYRFDGSALMCYPSHDPCDGIATTNHKRNVSEPGGAIFLR